MNDDFTINEFIAKAPTLGRIDGVVAGVRIPVHEAGVQDAHVRLMHPRLQVMRPESDFRVNPLRPPGVENPAEDRRGGRGAQGGGADHQKQGRNPRPGSKPPGKPVASGAGRGQGNVAGGRIRQDMHRWISKIGARLEHPGVACGEILSASLDAGQ
jgi:hypothetical protein